MSKKRRKGKSTEKSLPMVCDVDIKLLDMPGKIKGCLTLSAVNDAYQANWFDENLPDDFLCKSRLDWMKWE